MKKLLASRKTLLHLALFIGFFTCAKVTYSQNALLVKDATSTDQEVVDYPAVIEQATLRVEPQGIYAKFELEMELAANTDDNWQENDSLELVFHFDLPQQAIIYDAFLWTANNLVPANIYERDFGTEMYTDISQRKPQPLLLLKMNQGKYQLRIFPLPATENRKIRFDFLLPAQWKNNLAQVTLPTALLQSSVHTVPILLELHENEQFPMLTFSDPTLMFSVENGIQTLATDSDVLSVSSYISWELPTENGLWLHVDETNKTYQYLFDLSSQVSELDFKRDIVLVVHTEDAEMAEEDIKKNLNRAFELYLNDQSRVAILINDSFVNPDQPWFTDLEDVKNALNNAVFNINNSLQEKIRAANLFLGEQAQQQGIIVLASSDTLTNNQNEDIENWLGDLSQHFPTIIWDLRNWEGSSNFNFNRTIDAYLPLLQWSGGFIARNGSAEDRLFRGFENRSIKAGYAELEVEPVNGLTYARYGNAANELSEGISPQYRQFGKFFGDLQWEIDYSVLIDGQFFNNNLNAELSNNDIASSYRVYNGNKFIDREKNSPNSPLLIFESIAERILTTKTAFLSIDTSLVAEYECLGCDTSLEELVGTTENTRTDRWDAQVVENPSTETLSLQWETAPAFGNVNIQVIFPDGKPIYQETISETFGDKTLFFQWRNAKYLPSGIYFVRILIENEVQILRFIKS